MTKKIEVNTYIIDDDFTLEVVEDEPEITEKPNIETYLNQSDSESELVIDEEAEDAEKNTSNEPLISENKERSVDTLGATSEIDTGTHMERIDDDKIAELEEIITLVKTTKESVKNTSALFYKCPICTRYVCKRKPKFLRHLDIHLAEKNLYKCEKCNFVSAQESYFSLHKIKCNAHRLKCHWCDFYTFKIRVLNKHVNTKHQRNIEKKKKLNSDVEKSQLNLEVSRYI